MKDNNLAFKVVLSGMCVSPGTATGVIRYYKPGKEYTKTDILILNEWVTSNVALLKNVGGLISKIGGLTSHASVIAREYNIPCIVGVGNLESLEEGAKITLDATNEKISVL